MLVNLSPKLLSKAVCQNKGSTPGERIIQNLENFIASGTKTLNLSKQLKCTPRIKIYQSFKEQLHAGRKQNTDFKILGKISFNQEFFIQPNYQSGVGVGNAGLCLWYLGLDIHLITPSCSFYLLTSYSSRVTINGTDCALH